MSQEKYLECGKLVNTHGVRGAMMLESWCDAPDVLLAIKKLYYKKKEEYIALNVVSASVHKGRVLITFDGIDTMDKALLLKNRVLYADREDIPLDEDRVFIADIIGLPVFDARDGSALGKLADVIESPASDLFAVHTPAGHEVLVPAVDAFIDHIDPGDGVYLLPIAGMFDGDEEVIPGGAHEAE